MISYLEGTIIDREGDAVTLLVGGVGYRIQATRLTSEIGQKATFFIAEVIREDRYDLFGFASKDERALFYLLTDVQGVGPKIGQKILAAAAPEALRSHIEKGDLGFFTAISGVGKKTAQKIILDLKGVLVSEGKGGEVEADDVTDALESLGYSRNDIAAVIPHVVGTKPEERVKSALQLIGKRR